MTPTLHDSNLKIDAALIAGGRSRRFGEDKAFAPWRGEPLWLVQIRKLMLIPKIDQIFLSTNPDQIFPEHIEGVTRLNDIVADIGPLGAFKTVFEKSNAERLLLLAVDMPMVTWQSLAEGIAIDPPSLPKINDRWEPLAGCYQRGPMLDLINQQIELKQFSLQNLLDIAEERGLIQAKAVAGNEVNLYANLNTKEEYDALGPTGPGASVSCGFFTLQSSKVDDTTQLRRYKKGIGFDAPEADHLAREEPLEVRVNERSVAVMMRTPGHDDELATGFLLTEGVIKSSKDIIDIEHCPDVDPEGIGNTLNVKLRGNPNLDDLTRHVFTSSSCGVCGKATISSVFQSFPPIKNKPDFDPEVILSLPAKLRASQDTFDKTGGLHASALFSLDGEMAFLREDVGRHNALDKVIGRALREEIDLSKSILLVSGRISFELIQKALAARIPIVAGISAPSSLAVDFAKESGQTLIGFLRERGFNLY